MAGTHPIHEGDNRTPFDALLYGALLVLLVIAIFSDGTGPMPALGTTVGVLPPWQIWAVLGVLAVLGLRDKVIFLAARGEVYASFTVAFLFAGYGVDMIVAAKLVCLVIWLGAATSKLNKHFPFVISTMMSNNPMFRPRFIKRPFFEDFPDDLRPGGYPGGSRISAPRSRDSSAGVVLLPRRLADGDRRVRHGVLPLRHLSSIPMGVPLEWNVFMMFSVWPCSSGMPRRAGRHDHAAADRVVRRRGGHRGDRKPVPAQGVVPAWHAVLRGQLGHHAVVRQALGRGERSRTAWCRSRACRRPRWSGTTAARRPRRCTFYMGYAFRAFNTHGRAMFTLAHQANGRAEPGRLRPDRR